MTVRSILRDVGATPTAVRFRRRLRFRGTGDYWERRYAAGGDSGAGSYGRSAEWKAGIVNGWVAELKVHSVVDLGCGDGNQLGLAEYPRYLGLDLSPEAIRLCIRRFAGDPTKSFLSYSPESSSDPAGWLRADLALSMEVIFHLVEDEIFEDYMARLFNSAERYVAICCSDRSGLRQGPHERHRPFTPWVREHRPDWVLERKVDPPSDVDVVSSLYLYRREDVTSPATG